MTEGNIHIAGISRLERVVKRLLLHKLKGRSPTLPGKRFVSSHAGGLGQGNAHLLHHLPGPRRLSGASGSEEDLSKAASAKPDTVPEVMNDRRKTAPKPSPAAPIVHNFAALSAAVVNKPFVSDAGCGPASKQTRSREASPKRTLGRLPAVSKAPAKKSERTTSCEDPVSERLTAAAKNKHRNLHRKKHMPKSQDCKYFAGFDWASQHHQVVIVDTHGQIVIDFQFDDSAAGWELWRQKAKELAPLAVCIETNRGAIIERLLQTESCAVYPIHPKVGKAYRERKTPSGAKTDFRDAWAFADALRVDGRTWKQLQAEDPLMTELRLLCRDEVALIGERTALVNQLRKALAEYYPVALKAFDDWTVPSSWSFVQRFPTPAALAKAGKRQWEKFLHTHYLYRPETASQRLGLFASALEFTAGDSITQAKSRLALTRVRQLLLLERELEDYRQRIETLFKQHPDHDLFGSLPGAGPKLAPRLLAEIGQDRTTFETAQALQCYAGTAPISFQSGQMHRTRIRRHCNTTLRSTVHLWADLSRKRCSWAQVYYKAARNRGKTHACAMRCLGQRWLKILWKMWQTRSCYNAELHTQNQLAHGSWLLQIKPT